MEIYFLLFLEFDFERLVWVAAICYNNLLLAVLTNEQLLIEKKAWEKF